MTHTVLVIEQNELNRKLFHDLLEVNGYRTLYANDSAAAVSLARTESPDVIVTDLRLAQAPSLDVVRQLKGDDASRSIPVIGVTAPVGPGDEEVAVNGGCDVYLQKPFAPAAFLDAVRRLVTPMDWTRALALAGNGHHKTARVAAAAVPNGKDAAPEPAARERAAEPVLAADEGPADRAVPPSNGHSAEVGEEATEIVWPANHVEEPSGIGAPGKARFSQRLGRAEAAAVIEALEQDLRRGRIRLGIDGTGLELAPPGIVDFDLEVSARRKRGRVTVTVRWDTEDAADRLEISAPRP